MKTQTKQHKDKYLNYLLENIDFDGYDMPDIMTDAQKVEALAQTFYTEKLKHHKQWFKYYGGLQNALADWIQGAPSTLHLPFYHDDIVDFAVSMGSLKADASDKQKENICNNYYRYMAAKILKLFKAYKVDIYAIINQ